MSVFIALVKERWVTRSTQMMATVNEVRIGTPSAATRTIGTRGVIMASGARQPVMVGLSSSSGSGAEKPRRRPWRRNWMRMKAIVIRAVAPAIMISKLRMSLIGTLKMEANVCQFATLSASPVANAMRKMHPAVAAGMPIEMKIGRTIVPTIMIDPRPDRTVKSRAVTADRRRTATSGRSPPSSADFLIMVSVTPVRLRSWPSQDPKMTAQ